MVSTDGQKAPRSSRKRATKRDLLFDEAAHQINAVGSGAIAINDIAEKVGLTRTALYYYVTDRADLVFGCYQRACEAIADDLATASQTAPDPASRLAKFVALQLDFDRPTLAVLNDVDSLPDHRRVLVRELQARNVEALRLEIDAGIKAGVFRPCQTEIIAQALLGMIAWTRLSAGWLGHRDGRATRRRAAEAITELLLHGFATGLTRDLLINQNAEGLLDKPVNPFDRQQANAQKMSQLVAVASKQFSRRGIDSVSLDDIVGSVGASKGVIYHYFDDKAALVVSCYQRAFELYEVFMATAQRVGRSGFEKAIICLHLNVQAQAGALSPLMLQPGRLSLPEADRIAFTRAGHRLRMASSRNLRLGAVDGSCRPSDTVFMGEVSAGLFFWLPKWLPEEPTFSPIEIADEICSFAAFGLQADRT